MKEFFTTTVNVVLLVGAAVHGVQAGLCAIGWYEPSPQLVAQSALIGAACAMWIAANLKWNGDSR